MGAGMVLEQPARPKSPLVALELEQIQAPPRANRVRAGRNHRRRREQANPTVLVRRQPRPMARSDVRGPRGAAHQDHRRHRRAWKELGMSRRTWYRRNKERNGTTSSAALLSYVHADESVPTVFETLAGDLRMVALGLLPYAKGTWSDLSRAA